MKLFINIDDPEVMFEGFSDAAGTNAEKICQRASEFVNAEITKFHPQPSTALPDSGTSPNFYVRLATECASTYIALSRRMITSVIDADEDSYWTVFQKDALGIIKEIKEGEIRLDPDPKIGEVGIGMTQAFAVADVTDPVSNWIESNSLVPSSYYQDDVYKRVFYLEIQEKAETLKLSKFRFKTDMTIDTDWERENIFMNVTFCPLSHGVAVRFLSDNFDSFEVGMMWKIECFPERDSKNKAVGIQTFFMERG